MSTNKNKTTEGAELRARRERLGLSETWIEVVLNSLDVGAGACGCDSTNGRIRRQTVEEEVRLVDWYDAGEMEKMRTAYAAALTAEEQRQAREALEHEVVDGAVTDVHDVPIIKRLLPDLYRTWYAARAASLEESAASRAILAALREAAGEPAQVVGVDMASEPDRTVVTAATLTEPVAPEGVTVRTVTDCKCTYVSINRGCRDNLIATVWHSDARAICIEDGYAKPEALRFIADLADYRAAQHAAGEQQRKIDAVKAAEEAFKAADGAYVEACAESTRRWKVRQEALIALNAAKREAGL